MPFFMLHPREIEFLRRQKNAVVVDIRKQSEYRKYHYKNAVSMPYSDDEKWVERFHKGQNYILYCDYGNVSLWVARELAKKGIAAYTVVGGMQGMQRYSSQNGQ